MLGPTRGTDANDGGEGPTLVPEAASCRHSSTYQAHPTMARTLIIGTLLVGLGAVAMGNLGGAETAAQEPPKQEKKVADDKSKTTDDTKKDKKAEKVTVWILDATGTG